VIARNDPLALQGLISIQTVNPGTSFGPGGAINGAEVSIVINVSLVLEYEDQLRASPPAQVSAAISH
jgi:hypothetical protein